MQPIRETFVATNIEQLGLCSEERLLQTTVAIAIIGFAIAFFTQNILGLAGFGIALGISAIALWTSKETVALNRLSEDIQEITPQLDRLNTNSIQIEKSKQTLNQDCKTLKGFYYKFKARIPEIRLIARLFSQKVKANGRSLNPQIEQLIQTVKNTKREIQGEPEHAIEPSLFDRLSIQIGISGWFHKN